MRARVGVGRQRRHARAGERFNRVVVQAHEPGRVVAKSPDKVREEPGRRQRRREDWRALDAEPPRQIERRERGLRGERLRARVRLERSDDRHDALAQKGGASRNNHRPQRAAHRQRPSPRARRWGRAAAAASARRRAVGRCDGDAPRQDRSVCRRRKRGAGAGRARSVAAKYFASTPGGRRSAGARSSRRGDRSAARAARGSRFSRVARRARRRRASPPPSRPARLESEFSRFRAIGPSRSRPAAPRRDAAGALRSMRELLEFAVQHLSVVRWRRRVVERPRRCSSVVR